MASGVIEKPLQHLFQRRIHFPVVGCETDVSASSAGFVEGRHELFHRRAGHETVASELRMPGIAQHMRVHHPIRFATPCASTEPPDTPPVRERTPVPWTHR